MNRRHLVFVYGTLKSGYHNFDRYLRGSHKVGNAATRRAFHVTCVGYPVAYRSGPDPLPVNGEVYLVNNETMAKLDRLEGVPYLYQRTSEIVLVDGTTQLRAWMYTKRPGQFHGDPCPVVDGAYVWSR